MSEIFHVYMIAINAAVGILPLIDISRSIFVMYM